MRIRAVPGQISTLAGGCPLCGQERITKDKH